MGTRAWEQKSLAWQVEPPFDGAEDLARRLGTAPLIAQMLHNRGIHGEDAGRAFLQPKLNDLHPPELLAGIDVAAERIARAVKSGEKIVIYGDYDVDGMTAVAILHACLCLLGCPAGSVEYYVPHRLEEGYGVNVEAVRKIIAGGSKLLVTVDCGISAAEPLAEAVAAGVDVIVTDHHTPPAELPAVLAIVHPLVPAGEYPNPDLCGAGVAFKLAWQVARAVCGNARVDEPMRDFLLDATCLAALGTIADVVPLVGENRVLAAFGLRGLPSSRHAGLRALLEEASLTDQTLDAYHVGFVLAPRLNACGRMGHASLAVELLTGTTPERCAEIAGFLSRQNAERQRIEREIAEQAVERVLAAGMDRPDRRAIVLAGEDWHGGVIGIVAARLVSRFNRPAVLIAVNGDGNGQGSCRSIPGFHMRDALAACAAHLTGFGGHAMAGGLRVAKEQIAGFSAAFLEYAARNIPQEQLAPSLRIDAETTLSSLNRNLLAHLARLAPFGQGNPSPVVAVRGCKVLIPPRRIGRSGGTVCMTIGQNGAAMRAIGFNMGDLAEGLVGVNTVDVAGEPAVNSFQGRESIEMKLHDVKWGA